MAMEKVTLVFTQQQLSIINSALVQMPFIQVAHLIDQINKQIAELESIKTEIESDSP
jgi:hypothetical protein